MTARDSKTRGVTLRTAASALANALAAFAIACSSSPSSPSSTAGSGIAGTYSGTVSGGSGSWGAGNQGEYICRCSSMQFSGTVSMNVSTAPDGSVTGTGQVSIQGTSDMTSCTNLVPNKNPNACSSDSTRTGPFEGTPPISGSPSDIRWKVSRPMCAGGHEASATFQGNVQGNAIVGTVTLAGTCLPDYYWELVGSVPVTLTKR